MKLIDKDALVAEIERRIEHNTEWKNACKTIAILVANHAIEEDKKILSIINTLEAKEVDLEKEFDDYIEKQNAFTNKDNSEIKYYNGDSFNHVYDIYPIAKHFFELGLKAQKGE